MAAKKQRVNLGLYQVLAELMDDHVFVVDEDEKFLYINSHAAGSFGLTPREVIGLTVKDLFPPHNYCHQSRDLRQVFQTGTVLSVENLLSFPREEVWLETRLVPIKDRSGDVVAVLGFARDVSERRRREEASTQAKRDWERAFDSIDDPVAVIGLDHRVQRVNRAMAERLGLTPQKTLGVFCHEFMHDSGEPPPFCPLLKLMDDGTEHVAEIRDGGPLDGHLVKVSPLRDPDGSVIGCIHVARTVASVLPQAEPDQRTRERFFTVLKSVEYLTAIQDTEGKYLLIDSVPPAENFGEVVGKCPSDFLDSFTAAGIMEQLQKVMVSGASMSRLTRITLGSEAVSFHSHMSPVRGSTGKVTAVATVSRKVDDQAWTKADIAALSGSGLSDLTKREREVLKLIASGMTSRQIGEKLFISAKTVVTHRSRIMQKLDLHTTVDLVKYSFRFGL
jgi:PAS domain S-box-containing protein